jgi:glycosyltransferase involved in cell wall biosynthesis
MSYGSGISDSGHPLSDSSQLVSVIIPAYNSSPYIQEALDSVFAQTYPNYEVIVVNDGSPDTSELELVLAPYRQRVIYITQENRGLAGARNTGLRMARGEFVALLDADDIWLPDYLQEQLTFLAGHPEFDLCYCNARFFGDSVFSGKDFMTVCPSNGDVTAAAIISGRCHVFVSVTARRTALSSIGFDESLRSCEDFDCWLRFTAAGHRIGYHRTILVLYRKHGKSLSADPVWMAEHHIQVLTKDLSLWPEGSEEVRLLQESRKEVTADLNNLRAKMALSAGNFSSAREHLVAANQFYRSLKNAVAILLLRLMPSVVRFAYQRRRPPVQSSWSN